MLVRGRASDVQKKVVPLEKMKAQYYRARKFDQKGIPQKECLKRLGIL